MPEIRTFNNPIIEKSSVHQGHWYFADQDRHNGEHFHPRDWDITVTVTRKPEPPKFKAGDRVDFTEAEYTEGDSLEPGTVVGYENGKVLVVWDIAAGTERPNPIQAWAEDALRLI